MDQVFADHRQLILAIIAPTGGRCRRRFVMPLRDPRRYTGSELARAALEFRQLQNPEWVQSPQLQPR